MKERMYAQRTESKIKITKCPDTDCTCVYCTRTYNKMVGRFVSLAHIEKTMRCDAVEMRK